MFSLSARWFYICNAATDNTPIPQCVHTLHYLHTRPNPNQLTLATHTPLHHAVTSMWHYVHGIISESPRAPLDLATRTRDRWASPRTTDQRRSPGSPPPQTIHRNKGTIEDFKSIFRTFILKKLRELSLVVAHAATTDCIAALQSLAIAFESSSDIHLLNDFIN